MTDAYGDPIPPGHGEHVDRSLYADRGIFRDDPDAECECGHPAYLHTNTIDGDCLHRDPVSRKYSCRCAAFVPIREDEDDG